MTDMSFMVGSSGIANAEGKMRTPMAVQARIGFGGSPRHPFATQAIVVDMYPSVRSRAEVRPQRGMRPQVRVRMVRPQQKARRMGIGLPIVQHARKAIKRNLQMISRGL